MKKLGLIIVLSSLSTFSFSCSSFLKKAEQKPETVVSDLFPQGLSRTVYYENLATGYADSGQVEKAAELFRLAVLHDPTNLSARLKLADQYVKQKAGYLAEIQLKEVIRLNPENTVAQHKLADLYLMNQIFSKAEPIYQNLFQNNGNDKKAAWALYLISKAEKNFDLADVRLQQVQKIANDPVSVTLEKASLLKLQSKWNEEQDLLEQAYQDQPNTLPVVSALSEAYFRSANWAKATVILQRFNETNSFNFEISEKLSFAAVQVQNYEVALDQYAKQKSFRPYSTQIDLKVAHVYFLMEDYAQAEQTYLGYLSQNEVSEGDEASYYLSKIYQLTNRFDQSAIQLKRIETTSEYFSVAQIELANLDKEKDFVGALTRLGQAHQLRPELLDITKSYVDLLIADHQFSEAIALLEDTIPTFPDDEDLRLKIAYSYYQVNSKQAFEEQMTEAIKINPKNSEIYSALAQLWFVKTKKGSEVEFFAKQAIELKSKNVNLKPLLAWALLDQNKSAQAIALFEQYYEQNPGEYYYAKSLADVYRYALINSKAEQFSKIALTLESNMGLNAILHNKATRKVGDFDTDKAFNSRVPASLENY